LSREHKQSEAQYDNRRQYWKQCFFHYTLLL
jgi:hypothetical protein